MNQTDQIISKFSAAQGGVVSRRQLSVAGVTIYEIRSRIRSGRLSPVQRGEAFLVSGVPVTETTALRTGLIVVPGSAASHESAARLLRIDGSRSDSGDDITAGISSAHRAAPVRVHRSGDLIPARITVVDGIRCTDVDRTLVDLGAVWSHPRLMTAVEGAIVNGRTSMARLTRELDRVAKRGRHGVVAVRKAFDELGASAAGIESPLEMRFARLLQGTDLPAPVRQWSPPWGGELISRVDAAFLESRVIVELDGRTWHDRRSQSARDKRRDHLASSHGWVVIRFDAEQLRTDPTAVVKTLRATLGRRNVA